MWGEITWGRKRYGEGDTRWWKGYSWEVDNRCTVEKEISWRRKCPGKRDMLGRGIPREVPASGKSVFWVRVLSEILYRKKTFYKLTFKVEPIK